MFGGPRLQPRPADSLHMVRGPGTGITTHVHDHDVTIINIHTGQIIRKLTIDPTRDYQPIGPNKET